MSGWTNSDRRRRLPADWRHRRERILRRDGQLCTIRGPGCTVLATEVDHVRAGDDHSDANLASVCHTCHERKTVAERPASNRRRPPEPHPGMRN